MNKVSQNMQICIEKVQKNGLDSMGEELSGTMLRRVYVFN